MLEQFSEVFSFSFYSTTVFLSWGLTLMEIRSDLVDAHLYAFRRTFWIEGLKFAA